MVYASLYGQLVSAQYSLILCPLLSLLSLLAQLLRLEISICILTVNQRSPLLFACPNNLRWMPSYVYHLSQCYASVVSSRAYVKHLLHGFLSYLVHILFLERLGVLILLYHPPLALCLLFHKIYIMDTLHQKHNVGISRQQNLPIIVLE